MKTRTISRPPKRRRLFPPFRNAILPFSALLLLLALPLRSAAASAEPTDPPTWDEVQKLVSEQKYEAASKATDAILERARETDDAPEWTRALIETVKLRTALHGYETAVRFLREEEWPDDPASRAILELYYADSLRTYLQAYSWEIRRRESVETGQELDLKHWDVDRITREINLAFLDLWNDRESWGEASIGEFGRYIRQNDYPARIRGTLRDTVTYLWAEFLADTSFWRPEMSNEVFLLDLHALLDGRPGGDGGVDLADPSAHPLEKISAILGDLEGWHRAHRRPEAAYEARLERVRRLRAAFTAQEDRLAIRKYLEMSQQDFDRSLPWWSMGQALLAEVIREEPDPQALVRAREAAKAGRELHPKSPGGRRCASLVAQIEAPAYDVGIMKADGPDRRSIRISHRNLEVLHFRAYRYDLPAFLESSEDYNLFPDQREIRKMLRSKSPVAEWSRDLPPTPDYRNHVAWDTPPLREPGAYVIVSSVREDFAEKRNQIRAWNFLLTDLVLLTRNLPEGCEVTVRRGDDGAAVEGADITLYALDYRKGKQHRVVTRLRSGADGRVFFPREKPRNRRYVVVARRGGSVAVEMDDVFGYVPSKRGTSTSALIYTDRSVYRPGQTLHWKVVAYRGGGEDFRYETLPNASVRVTLRDANGETVAETLASTSGFGSAFGSFEIPEGRLLGQWQLRTSLGGSAPVRVEEYKRPTFEVSVSDPETPLRLNRPARLSGEARYYFGLPVTVGSVRWRVTREPIFPRWWWWGPRPAEEVQVVASGRTELDSEGGFVVEFTPAADERDAGKGITFRYRLAVDVTDEGGETRSAERTFRLGFTAVEARIHADFGFLEAGDAASLKVTRSSLDGVPQPGTGSWRLVALEQPPEAVLPADVPIADPWEGGGGYRTDGDRLRPRWETGYDAAARMASWEGDEEIASGEVEHGEDGSAEIRLPKLPAGVYRIVYTTKDAFGALFTTSETLVVSGGERVPATLPALLRFEHDTVPVGDRAKLLVHSALRNQEMVLEFFRDGRRFDRRVLVAGKDDGVLEIPIGPGDRGGFGVTLTLLRDYQTVRCAAKLFVPWDDRKLQVSFSTFRDRIRPGTRETFRVTVRGHDGAPVDAAAAELLAYMYDRSLDIFAPHTPPAVENLYPARNTVGRVQVSLGTAWIVWSSSDRLATIPSYPRFRRDRLDRLDGYGIGGPGRRGGPRMLMKMAGAVPEEEMGIPAPAAQLADRAAVFETAADEASPGLGGRGGAGAAEEPPPVELRSDFSETAFWEPRLLLSQDGSVSIEFDVPDSVTDWNVWVHALTRDLRGGSARAETRSVKELMVRPYLPRFVREGDRAIVKVVVNNAGGEPLEGRLDFEILDPETDEDLRPLFDLPEEKAAGVPFAVDPGGGVDLAFPVKVPVRVGTVAFRVTARAGDFSDGELRALPVLPGRMHLVQSRFVTLHDRDRRELSFPDMAAGDDPSLIQDQLVVTIDAQLFYSVLNALPYLVSYPYECTEQTLNRFLSTGIVSSLYDDYPAVERMAEKLSKRQTRLEPWDAADPNRKMALEETPWLVLSRGGGEDLSDLINVLDPTITRAERESALAGLRKSQTSLGGFPWWPGGPPSPYMTLYVLYGFSKGLEFGVEAPRDLVTAAWGYMHRHYVDELVDKMMREDCCWETITFLNYVLSNYPDASWTGGVFSDDDREKMLEFGWRHWKEMSPLLKGYLALTLERAGRHEDAVLVFDSVMDSAKSDPDLGTYWAPEDRAWLWYNDTIETHAFALRVLTELQPQDARRHGLVQWLLLNKKLNHWKSTRATSEVLYSLAHYLKQEGSLAVREEIRVEIGPRKATFVFEPDRYTGARNRVVVPGPQVDPSTMSTIVVEKATPGFAFASATWHFSTERLPEEARGDLFSVTRRYFRRFNDGTKWVLRPLEEDEVLQPGDQVEVHLSIRAKHAAEYVHLRDPRGAGFEPETLHSRYKWDLGIGWYEEVRDSGTNFFFEWLPAGEYTFKYRLRAAMAGEFRVGPAVLQSMYAPEFAAYSAGNRLEIASDGAVGP